MNESGQEMTWQDAMYERVFEEELRGLERRALNDPDFSVDALRRQLKDLYSLDGQDMLGRGAAGDITSSAQLAAWEHFEAILAKKAV
jgi:hypothetical protein